MNCEDFEMLLAEALGDELASSDREPFETHLAQCPRCRRDYETARDAVAAMRELPGPQRVNVVREGNRLVIEEIGTAGVSPTAGVRGVPGRVRPRLLGYAAPLVRSVFRYAASVLIAFGAGYALHAGLMLSGDSPIADAGRTGKLRMDTDQPAYVSSAPTSFQRALTSTHMSNPARSNLAKCLIAMAHGKR
jgi:anti-sigma factor RsiW